jgi:hypothetical protein
VTGVWLEEISRIKRRITTGGGEKKDVIDFIIHSVEYTLGVMDLGFINIIL